MRFANNLYPMIWTVLYWPNRMTPILVFEKIVPFYVYRDSDWTFMLANSAGCIRHL
jgi:hypothetical protein